jgi:hypothetical protein
MNPKGLALHQHRYLILDVGCFCLPTNLIEFSAEITQHAGELRSENSAILVGETAVDRHGLL